MAEKDPRFDPYPVLQALEERRVQYVVIGAFARVLQGTEELTRSIDIVPSLREENLRRLETALKEVGAKRRDRRKLDLSEASLNSQDVVPLATDYGELKLVPTPDGTRGYDDLRRGANREPLGRGVRPSVASVGDLARMASAYDRDRYFGQVMQLRRLTALEHSRSRVIER